MKSVVLVLLVAAACGKGGGAAAGGKRDRLLGSWKTGGLEPSAFTAAQTPVGKDCASGTVNNLDVLICTFATPDEAKQAQAAGYAWVGDTTGAVQVKGALVIAIADRRKADPSGRSINKLMKLAED
jgi:hypothetical protein